MRKKTAKTLNLSETFTFHEFPWQTYPVYSLADSGRVYNFKSVVLPSATSRKRFTRRKQLVHRSMQAKIFDAFLNVGYFDPLPVVREFPVLIQNSKRLPGQSGGFYLIDYYFPTALSGKGLFIELDSELHDPGKDEIRDKYLLNVYGIKTFRINNLEKEVVQKGKFKELCELLRSEPASKQPECLPMMTDILDYVKTGGLGPYSCETQ